MAHIGESRVLATHPIHTKTQQVLHLLLESACCSQALFLSTNTPTFITSQYMRLEHSALRRLPWKTHRRIY